MDSDDKILTSYNEVNSMLKTINDTSSFTIDYSKLDGETINELKQAIVRVLTDRYHKLSSMVGSNLNEFIIR